MFDNQLKLQFMRCSNLCRSLRTNIGLNLRLGLGLYSRFSSTLNIALGLIFRVVPLLVFCFAAFAKEKSCRDDLDCPSAWTTASASERKTIFEFAEEYKLFMDVARTELSFVTEAVALAEAAGFRRLEPNSSMRPGTRYFDVNRDRAIALMVIGDKALSEGMRVVGAHIDSPRLELKSKPLFAANEFALFQTNYHGGIKRYQWTNIPLALVGIIDKKDGTRVQVSIGLKDGDPILMIPDISPHVDRGYNNKKVDDLLSYESLDPIVAHIPSRDEESNIEDQVLSILKSEYNVTRADLVSAELSLVPAYHPRDMGLDRGMVAAYGQDDKLGAYAALRAILESGKPNHTALAYLVDNEEVGNVNNTGAKSDYFSNLVARLLYAKLGKEYRDIDVRKALRHSKMISIDVNPGVNPMRASAWELNNAPKLGYGVNFKMYGRGFTANSEFTAEVRQILDEANVPWQTATYKVGKSGGGTIGGEFSRQDMEVIDFGVPVLSIHTPYAASSKIDIYNLYLGSKAFFEY